MHDLCDVPKARTIASIFLLPHCAMSCRFCASELAFDLMTFEQAVGLLEALRGQGFANVVLGGGEPFLWPHGVARLAGVAKRLRFFVQTSTNGLDLPEGFERLAAIDRFLLPLESSDAAIHDALRSGRRLVEGHHAVVLDRIEALVRARHEFTVSTVVTRENLDGLPDLASRLADLVARGARIHAWHLYRFVPVGRGGVPNARELAPAEDDYRRVTRLVQSRSLGFAVIRRDHMLRSRTVEYFWFEGGELQVGCRRVGAE